MQTAIKCTSNEIENIIQAITCSLYLQAKWNILRPTIASFVQKHFTYTFLIEIQLYFYEKSICKMFLYFYEKSICKMFLYFYEKSICKMFLYFYEKSICKMFLHQTRYGGSKNVPLCL